VIEKQEIIAGRLEDVTRLLVQLISKDNQVVPSTGDLPLLPIKTESELTAAEQYLHSTEHQNNFVSSNPR